MRFQNVKATRVKGGSCLLTTGILAAVVSLVPLFLAGVVLLMFSGGITDKPRVSATLVPSRTITEVSLPLQERWRKRFFIPDTLNTMAAAQGALIVTTTGASNTQSILHAYNAIDGNLEWEVDTLPEVYSLYADTTKAYLAVPFQLRAFDLTSGAEFWRSEEIPTNKVDQIKSEDGFLILYSNEDSFNSSEVVTRLVDKETGVTKEQSRTQVSANTRLLYASETKEFWRSGDLLWASSKQNSSPLWQRSIEDPVHCSPSSNGRLLVLSQRTFSYLYLLDQTSGRMLWKYPEVVISNGIQIGKIVFVMREDGDLVGLDAGTGKLIGSIKFSSKRDESSNFSGTYLLSAYKDTIYAYWGDSQEVIAFTYRGY